MCMIKYSIMLAPYGNTFESPNTPFFVFDPHFPVCYFYKVLQKALGQTLDA